MQLRRTTMKKLPASLFVHQVVADVARLSRGRETEAALVRRAQAAVQGLMREARVTDYVAELSFRQVRDEIGR
jgi:hypothetical protein